jgi:hypothetical protein
MRLWAADLGLQFLLLEVFRPDGHYYTRPFRVAGYGFTGLLSRHGPRGNVYSQRPDNRAEDDARRAALEGPRCSKMLMFWQTPAMAPFPLYHTINMT